MIKFLNIYKLDKYIFHKFNKRINKLYKTSDFIDGEETKKFEKNFQKLIKSKYLLTCNSGTDAILIALKSLNLKKNSEVILPAMTYCSVAYSIIRAGFKPKVVDIEENRSTICPDKLKNKITAKTSAVIITHLHGSPCNIKEILKIIKRKKIKLIEDVAQAHGAFDTTCNKKGRILGSIGDAGCFSFYPGKNLGAYGDAGAVCFKSKKNYNFAKIYKNNGTARKFENKQIGINSRLDSIQSIFLDEKLKLLKKNNNKRKKIASFYSKKINNPNVKKLKTYNGAVFHQYVIITKKIKKLVIEFKKNKIEFGRHYPYTINQLPSLKKYFSKNEKFKNAEKIAKYGVSLPIDPNLNRNNQKKIIKIINNL